MNIQSIEATDSRDSVAQRLYRGINQAERNTDGALATCAKLIGELPAARRHVDVGAEITQPAVEAILDAMRGLGDARAKLVVAHKALQLAGVTMSFEPFTGEGGGKPSDPPKGSLGVDRAA